MPRHRSSSLWIVVLVMSMTWVAAAAAQAPAFDGRGWTVGHQDRNAKLSLTEYVLPGQTVEDWKELVTSSVFFQAVPIAPFVNQIRQLMSKDCPSLVWNVISEDEKTAVFEFRDAGCGGFEAQHELDRVTIEPDGRLYRLAYAVKTRTPLEAARRTRWLELLTQVPLVERAGSSAPAARPAGPAGVDSATMAAAQKIATDQLAAAVRKSGATCPEGVTSEVKSRTMGPKGPMIEAIVECSNGQRYTVLIDQSGAVSSFLIPK